MTPEEAVAKGAQARQAIEVLNEAMEIVKSAIVANLLAASPQDVARIVALHGSAQIVDAVRRTLIATIADGDMAEAQARAQQAMEEFQTP